MVWNVTNCKKRAVIATVSSAAIALSVASGTILLASRAYADALTSVSGSVVSQDGVVVSDAKVELVSVDGRVHKITQTSLTGEFNFSPLEFSTYHIQVTKRGFQSAEVTSQATSGTPARFNIHLNEIAPLKELIVQVKAKRNFTSAASTSSKVEVDKERIATLPGGDQASLPKLISTTTPGVVGGPFGQLYIRGNHANIQYQIDGVQLPESTSGSFGDSFSPRNIDHMEIMTGDIPAEYGERTSAVVNIVTKSGPETPSGLAEMKYGSNNTFSPQLTYGGSNSSGRFRYFVAGSYLSTDRGLDTPDPKSYSDQKHGGTSPTHDKATGNDEFLRLDYQADDHDRYAMNLFNSGRDYQIPNYPSSSKSTDSFFQPGYTDNFGNANDDPRKPTYRWVPSNTNDTQIEKNTYAEFVWKRTLSDHAFLQVAPYFKRSDLRVGNDPANDLASISGPNAISGSQATSFMMDHVVDNFGLKSDYSLRLGESHLLKTGLQFQQSSGAGSFSIQTDPAQDATRFDINDKGYVEAVYVQDSYSILKPLTLNLGLRYSATQFKSDDISSQDGLLQPRVGLEYMATESTKIHIFYGRMFQPAPFENLRAAFTGSGSGNGAVPYDLKAEKDNYYETGVSQQIFGNHVVALNYYYKDAENMLDDAQLLNTSIAQPYNLRKGYATGVEVSIAGNITPNWQYFANDSYEDARGQGLSGGIFAFQPGAATANSPYQFLDHVQLNTANAGLTYSVDSYWATVTGLYGSGLRTGPDNSLSLPSHTSFDATIGYRFHDENFWSKWRVALDVNNIFDNAYPININNGFNGSHYVAGRQFFIRLAKEL